VLPIDNRHGGKGFLFLEQSYRLRQDKGDKDEKGQKRAALRFH